MNMIRRQILAEDCIEDYNSGAANLTGNVTADIAWVVAIALDYKTSSQAFQSILINLNQSSNLIIPGYQEISSDDQPQM